ncbi:MAG: GNAT family N-acetyltransferase [Acidobacteria bacterium]|nr:GNAT family N-acetyltransferase [Acidobacteriota bacterium]
MAVTLRLVQPEDQSFLYRLYASTRTNELAAWGWDAAQQKAFLELQFRAQEAHYGEFPNTEHLLILNDGQPVGRLLLSRMPDHILVVDIALLAECRGQGVGASVLSQVFDEATARRQVVRGHVAKDNRAQQLWWRLGFKPTGDTGTHYAVEWQPPNFNTQEALDNEP